MKHGKGRWRKATEKGNPKGRQNTYEGYFFEDKKHGYGEFIWDSGNIYRGNYHEDER